MTVPFKYNNSERFIEYNKPLLIKADALRMELDNFIQSVKGNEAPIVSGEAGRDALKVALEIQRLIKQDIH